MYSIGQQTIKNVNVSLDYIELQLKYQHVIPYYAHGWAYSWHEHIPGLTSALKCIIEIKNTGCVVDEDDYDYGNAIAEMAEVLVEDDCDTDVNGSITYDAETQRPLPSIKFFKMDYTHSASRTVEINGQQFKITVTYERKYTQKSI